MPRNGCRNGNRRIATMWARTQLKIDWRDLVSGATACLMPGSRDELARAVESWWGDGCETIAAYSVRSGFDLLLQALALEPDDEIVFSALNVRGMIKIARKHGLTAVPLDLDLDHMAPTVEELERAITEKSRVLVVAHLFGTRLELDRIFDCARSHGLVIVEDCAQAFNGRAYGGHPGADLSMFSFGPLKTATALGGALIRVRDRTIAERMRSIQAAYPVQSNRAQLVRVLKFAGLKIVTAPVVLGAIHRIFHHCGRDYEDAISDRVRNVAKLKSFKSLRSQPSAGMLGLLKRRIETFSPETLEPRAEKGRRLRSLIGDAVVVPAQASAHHDYWVFPVLVDDIQAYI